MRSDFLCSEYGCTAAEMDPVQKNELSHRGRALRAMRAIMEVKKRRIEGVFYGVLIVSGTRKTYKNLDRALKEAGEIDMFIIWEM